MEEKLADDTHAGDVATEEPRQTLKRTIVDLTAEDERTHDRPSPRGDAWKPFYLSNALGVAPEFNSMDEPFCLHQIVCQ